jgi:hypothetical protein
MNIFSGDDNLIALARREQRPTLVAVTQPLAIIRIAMVRALRKNRTDGLKLPIMVQCCPLLVSNGAMLVERKSAVNSRC